ncbi:MAG: DNA ligase D [Chloroflexota bacterium]
MSLTRYEQMRDFARTPEPAPHPPRQRRGPLTFTIQKHRARRQHYDLRLEIDGVLMSWPIPQGPSYDPSVRRLAIRTEDHPYDYGTFEGIIPGGAYGAGEVIVWDAGTYAVLDEDKRAEFHDRGRAEGLARAGKLSVFFNGRKLKGGWTLARTRGEGGGSQWLLIKRRDGLEDPARDVLAEDRSVLSGLRIEDLAAGVPVPRTSDATLAPSARGLSGARKAVYPDVFGPMLPTLTPEPFSRGDWLYEPKFDGYRVLAFVGRDKVRLFSRNGQAYEERFPEIARVLEAQPVDEAIVDGEIVAVGPDGRASFQRLQNHAQDPDNVLRFYAFDLLHLDGYDMRDAALSERKMLLHAVLAPLSDLVAEVSSFDDGLALFDAAQRTGLEGIVAKKRDSRYEPDRRVRTWLKIKTHQTDEFVVVGYTTGSGRRAGTLGSLILGRRDASGRLLYAGHVGTGFDEASLQDMLRRVRPLRRPTSPLDEPVPRGGGSSRAGGAAVWVEPRTVVEIKYAEQTADRRLRHPVFMRVREDKAAAEVRQQALVPPPSSEPTAQEGSEIAAALAVLEGTADRAKVRLEGYDLSLTNLNKEFWPAWGDRRALVKRDLVRYLLRVAPYVLPHLRDRPVTMTRFPNGIHGQLFYQRSPKESAPPFVERFVAYSEHNAGSDEYFVCNNVATLIWLAQLGDLELHVTHTRIAAMPDAPRLSTTFSSLEEVERSTLNHPDFLVIDLDPYLYSGQEKAGAEPELHEQGFARTREVARWFRETLQQIGIQPFLKSTGKTGLHLYVPIARTLEYDSVRAIAETLAAQVQRAHPRSVTTEWAVAARRGKVFLDWNMNRRSASLAAAYSPRAVPWAGVSTPLGWDELDSVYPTQFDLLNVPDRLAQIGDLWAHLLDARVDLRQMLGG